MTSIEVTDSAFEVLLEGLDGARREQRELGGSILACERDGRVLVAYALPTGPRADRGPGHIRTDADFQNEAIRKVRRRTPALQYVGDWHVHPMWLPDLSGTDRRTAREILLDDGARRDHLILLLVTAPPSGKAVVLGFVAQLSRQKAVLIGKAPIVRVADCSPEVVSMLGRPLLPLDDVMNDSGRPSPHDTERHQSAVTASRESFEELAMVRIIEDDLAEVRDTLDAEASLWRDEDLLGAVIRRGDQEALVLFPPEYPLGAPQVFAASEEDGPLAPVALRFGWSSLHRLVDPVSEALAPPAPAPALPPAPAPLRPSASAAPEPWSQTVLRALLSLFGRRRIPKTVVPQCPEVVS